MDCVQNTVWSEIVEVVGRKRYLFRVRLLTSSEANGIHMEETTEQVKIIDISYRSLMLLLFTVSVVNRSCKSDTCNDCSCQDLALFSNWLFCGIFLRHDG